MFNRSFTFRRRPSDESLEKQADPEARKQNTAQDGLPQTALTEARDDDAEIAPFASQGSRRSGTTFSIFNQSAGDQAQKNGDASAGPLGLNIVYEPEAGKRKVDIVFIHGLGGTSRFTWSKNKNPDLFWPLKFLPLDRDIGQARILSFGFNASFQRRGKEQVSIVDFAKELLFDLKFGTNNDQESLEIGSVPLIFVVHSMGGLIIKEAYILGQNDPQYEHIIKSIVAIMFLATPHRGTNLATVLNWILTSTFLSNAKQYINDLHQNSAALQKLNDQFRHIAPRLDIVSFYETRPTPIGLKAMPVMILEKDASVLGYPGETSKALDADHHNVCKYDDLRDPNYIIVRNVLKSLVSKALVSSGASVETSPSNGRQSYDLKPSMGITDVPDTDYIFFRDRWTEGTCQWILQDDRYLTWFDPTKGSKSSRLLWLNGGPGTGKSVLSSFIIDDIIKREMSCQYFFIRSNDQKKRTLSLMLRSIAYQISRSVPEFLKRTLEVIDEGIDLKSADSRTIWERLYKSILFRLQEAPRPLYWIIDGIDEAADPRLIFKQLGEISQSSLDVRILLVSRKTSEMLAAFSRLPSQLEPDAISIEGHLDDVRCYIRTELSTMTSIENMEPIVERIVQGSRNNFLWVRFAVEKISSSHSEEDIDEALRQLPAGMEALYNRMAQSIAEYESLRNRSLAEAILQITTNSIRTLSISELCIALNEDISKMLDMQKSIVDLCAGFVVIDNGANVVMVHQTAREYLTTPDSDRPLYIREDMSHGKLFLSCMRSLMTVGLRAKVQGFKTPEFLDYAAVCWSKHLIAMPHDFEQAHEILNKFLGGSWILIWIHYLSSTGQLSILVQAARHLSKYFAYRRRYQESSGRMDGIDYTRLALLEGWATDLVKIVGKFGRILRNSPDAIYKMIPPFCPQNSSIFQIFGKPEAKTLSVLSLTSGDWDDSIARISVNSFTVAVRTAGSCVAILAGSGTSMGVSLYDSSNFEIYESSPVNHKERVQRIELNNTGTILVTYGYRTTRVWNTSDGSCRLSTKNAKIGLAPLAIQFINNSTQLLVGTDDRCLRLLDLTEEQTSWWVVAEFEEEEIDGHFLNAASFMALNREATLVVVGYRGHPLSAWEVDGPQLLSHCYRTREGQTFDQIVDAAWNPHCEELFGLYYEGTLFRWRPYDDECEELAVGGSKLSVSRDGSLIATSDGRGTAKVFTTSDLDLIYRVTAEEGIFGIAFGPDSRRLYDIRGYHCNAWEPNALINYAARSGERTDTSSETESLALSSTDAGVSLSSRVHSVTALAASPKGRFYTYGTDCGDVFLYDSRSSTLNTIFTAKNLSIEHLQWSGDNRYLAVSYSGKKVVVISFTSTDAPGNSGKPALYTKDKLDIPLKMASNDGLISQLLFDKSSENLAIFCSKNIHVVSMRDVKDAKTLTLDVSTECTWLAHPDEDYMLIGAAATCLIISDWRLRKQKVYRYHVSPSQGSKGPSIHPSDVADISGPNITTKDDGRVVRAIITKGRSKHLLLQISPCGSASKIKLLLAFSLSQFAAISPVSEDVAPMRDDNTETTQPQTLTPMYFVPPGIAEDVALMLDILPQDRLVFLSRDSSVCLWQVPVDNFTMGARNSIISASSSIRPASGQPLSSQNRSRIGRHISLPSDASGDILDSTDRPRLFVRNRSNESVNLKSDRARSRSPSSATAFKTLFHLPGDWISRTSPTAALLWPQEKSLLCPRNGEVAMVRCSALS
ncbi:MAG: hypothetical protein M1814_006177 [Vezdaea aestivalis]|nr:MAG: hypothetical protein M1814_006177 [Vezdaea aestivalis]